MPSTSKRRICPILYIGWLVSEYATENSTYCLGERCAWHEICNSLPQRLEDVVTCLERYGVKEW